MYYIQPALCYNKNLFDFNNILANILINYL